MSDVFLYAVSDSDTQTVVYIGVTGNPAKRREYHRLRFGPTADLFVIKRVEYYSASNWETLAISAARRLGHPIENKYSGGGTYRPAKYDAPFQVLPPEVSRLQAALETEEQTLRLEEEKLTKARIIAAAQFQASLLQK